MQTVRRMGSGPLDQIVGLAIDRVPDSQVLMLQFYREYCGKHRANMVNALALPKLAVGSPHPRSAHVGKGRITVNGHQKIGFGKDGS